MTAQVSVTPRRRSSASFGKPLGCVTDQERPRLVAQFASLHGGRAWVQDRPGGGASFRVFLPAVHCLDASST